MEDVQIARRPFQIWSQTVLRLRCALQRGKVNRVRPRVAEHVAQSLPRALGQRRLQPVIVRGIDVSDEVDVTEEREFAVERTLTAVRIELVDVADPRSEEHTSELQSLRHLVCRLLLEKKKRI